MPGATGIRHGPDGAQTVPGVADQPVRRRNGKGKTDQENHALGKLTRFPLHVGMHHGFFLNFATPSRRAGGTPGNRRSRTPSIGGRDRRGSRYEFAQ